jgi:hypothetical protein
VGEGEGKGGAWFMKLCEVKKGGGKRRCLLLRRKNKFFFYIYDVINLDI